MFQRITFRSTPQAPRDEVIMNMKLTLVDLGRSLEFEEALVIGRDSGCDLQIDDAQVANRHVEIYPVGTLWWVRDLGSDGGTYLNGEIVEAAPLETSSEVRLGEDGPTVRLVASN